LLLEVNMQWKYVDLLIVKLMTTVWRGYAGAKNLLNNINRRLIQY